MKRKDFDDQRLYASVTAGLNQRFHQGMALVWTYCNRIVQISVAVLAIASLCMALQPKGTEWVERYEVPCAVAAAIAAVVLNIIPLGDWAQLHFDLFRRWTELREEVDALPFELSQDVPKTALVARLKDLNGRLHRLCAAEPPPNWLAGMYLSRCEDRERKCRPDIAPTSSPAMKRTA